MIRKSSLVRRLYSFRANELRSLACGTPHWGDAPFLRPLPYRPCVRILAARTNGKSSHKGSFSVGEPGGIQLRSVRSIVLQTPCCGVCTRFAPTNSGRLPAALPTGETLPSFAHSLTGRAFESSRLVPTEKAPTRGAFPLVSPAGFEPTTF